MNEVFFQGNPIQEYKTSLKRKTIHRGTVVSVESHAPFGTPMQCAIVELNNGLKGMIHENQFDTHKYRSLVGFIDHTIDFMVLDVSRHGLSPKDVNVFDSEKGIVLLSRVQAIEELQEDFWESIEVDHICPAVVSGFEDKRLYVTIKGVSCTLYIDDYEYDWTESMRNLIPLGKELTVKIKKIDREKRQVTVTRKELLEDPWDRVQEKFKVSDFYRGVITNIVPNVGIFIKLAPGIDALAWFPPRVPNHGQLIGKPVSVRIKSVTPDKRKIKCHIAHFPHEIY